MATNPCKTFPDGTHVSWHYRSAIGHGVIVSVARPGSNCAHTKFNIREFDHHVSESGSHERAIVQHYGSALTKEE